MEPEDVVGGRAVPWPPATAPGRIQRVAHGVTPGVGIAGLPARQAGKRVAHAGRGAEVGIWGAGAAVVKLEGPPRGARQEGAASCRLGERPLAVGYDDGCVRI